MELIKKLTSAFGPSGCEEEVSDLIINEIKEYVDEVRKDRLGNVIAVKKGKNGKKLMAAAHMDQIGIMVMDVEKSGYLRFTNVGYISPTDILGHMVRFQNGAVGVVAKEDKKEIKDLKLRDLYIDIGAENKEDALKRVGIGDFGIMKSFFEVNENWISTGALDDRIGCYALIEAAKRVKANDADIYFTFTVQEESYTSGAATSAYAIQPDAAVVLDVTDTGDTPNCSPMAVKLGGGAAIKVKDSGMICHPIIKRFLTDLAEKNNIKHQFEVLVGGSTDGSEIFSSRIGVLTGGISIPLRYCHTQQEVADINDVNCCIELLVKFLEEYK